MTQPHDRLIDEYLAAVAGSGADLPAHRLDDLVADLREHIASARADLAPETEAGVRTILARLGDPASIVAEARHGITPLPAPIPPAGPVPASGRRGTPGWAIALMVGVTAVLLTCVAVMLVGVVASQVHSNEGPRPAPPSNVDVKPSRSPGA